ncbi:energy-coupling factor transporter ATPase [Papillibacter cinnamivorans]|uniref:Energy-coupling factor transporter ATP-binding protein EcfA2 n=1 Tax=Papillibacter cinnamivorans DSM 12816 TaxID=1122930 RepID=A0A1W2B787_9FIRM|nr:energy-coupling factor transporter ATPase [Papillibacter cinnamivorans]SMC68835.1 energy-coupling factor transport system ATP-binding protein [Papillibacter cinnamivorans DSM 12816]
MAPIIQTENISHVYSAGTPFELAAIRNVRFQVEQGEFLGLMGHTGSGKSTLIQHLNGLLKPTAGRVLFQGEDIWSSPKKTRAVRFQVGLVFQYPEYQLFEETVYKDIAFGPKNMGLSDGEIDERVRWAAGIVGLEGSQLERSPFELSGGQKRRAAIAGVIAMRPEVLILDEPTAGLDPRGRQDIIGQIREYHRERGAAVVLVSHSMEEIARTADRIVVMSGGTVAMDGTPREIFRRAEELHGMGLAVPEVTAVMLRLHSLGLDVDPAAYTMEEARASILSLKGGCARA